MIFDREDVEILKRVRVRKGIETAALSCNPNLSEVQRMMVTDELVRDISRCTLMISVGTNDLSDIYTETEAFENDLSAFPPNLYAAYMEALSPSEREDEGQYIWMLSRMITMIVAVKRGLGIAVQLADADHVFSPQETTSIMRSRDALREILPRCEAISEDEPEVMGFARTALDECSLLLRIDSGKEVTSREASDCLDSVLGFDGEEFERIFGTDLDPSVMECISRLTEPRGRCAAVLFGRCVLNSANGSESRN